MSKGHSLPSDTASQEGRHGSLARAAEKPFCIMGIVNVTPDSFFDGGKHATAKSALEHARRLIAEGADILDIGGESTRPGSQSIDETEERRRVLPVISQLRLETDIPISIDTTKASIARDALEAGASWINDVSAVRFDPAIAEVAAEKKCPIILMHSRKTPATMQQYPAYKDVVAEVIEELENSVALCTRYGVARGNIILDPGIGFAKRFEDNITLLRKLSLLTATGFPLCIGTSRKSFIGQITGQDANNRLWGTLGSIAAAYMHGASIFRVHDVAAARECLSVLSTIESSS